MRGRNILCVSDFSKAIEFHAQHLSIAKEVGDRAGKGMAYGNLGFCLGRLVTRRHRRAWMMECVRRQSGSKLSSMVVMHLQNCTWRTSLDAGREDAALAISKSTSRGVCNGDMTVAPVWANAGRGHADAHVQRLPCSEVLQRRSSKDGFKKSRIGRTGV
jgi:hypothetical protein